MALPDARLRSFPDMMNLRLLTCLPPLLATALVSAYAGAQTHAVSQPESVVRAVAVYEWTGDDQAKPTASRIIPVSIFVDGRLRDADIYLARPVPLALDTGNLFEVEQAGEPQGMLEVAFARSLSFTGDQQELDSWLGYGFFKPKPKELQVAGKKSGPLPKIVVSGGKGPHLNSAPSLQADNSPPAKPQPVDRSDAAEGRAITDPDSQPDVDPDSAKNNPDRPTLRRRTPEQRKEAQKKSQQAAVIAVGSLTDDPDRPTLHRGREKSPEEEIAPLLGLPAGMHQAVAVSDPKDRPEHDFHRAWDSDAERAKVLEAMQDFARARLAEYVAHDLAPVALPAHATGPAHAIRTAAHPQGRRSAAAKKKAAPPESPAPQTALNDESLKGYTLSYGGDPAFVYTASSPGSGGVTDFVAVVAQQQPTGELKVALTSATDSAHLDRTARMLLVDAVDAQASNRASLLFELRAQDTRQFALYRVIGAQAEQTFVTDSIPSGAAARGTTLLHH